MPDAFSAPGGFSSLPLETSQGQFLCNKSTENLRGQNAHLSGGGGSDWALNVLECYPGISGGAQTWIFFTDFPRVHADNEFLSRVLWVPTLKKTQGTWLPQVPKISPEPGESRCVSGKFAVSASRVGGLGVWRLRFPSYHQGIKSKPPIQTTKQRGT